jgi:GNAT superfamily N-acetyltransferase
MDKITFHKATPQDVQTLVEYRIRFALEMASEQSEEAINKLKEQMTSYFARATAYNSCISFIAKCGDKIAGIGSMHVRELAGNFKNLSGQWGYIMNMYTAPEFRKRGVSTGILNELIEEGKKAGVTAFELHASKLGEPVYIKNGFEFHKEPTYRKYFG